MRHPLTNDSYKGKQSKRRRYYKLSLKTKRALLKVENYQNCQSICRIFMQRSSPDDMVLKIKKEFKKKKKKKKKKMIEEETFDLNIESNENHENLGRIKIGGFDFEKDFKKTDKFDIINKNKSKKI